MTIMARSKWQARPCCQMLVMVRGGGWRDAATDRELIVTPKVSAEDYGFRCVLILKRPAGP